MKIGNLDEGLEGPLGDLIVFDYIFVDGGQVPRYASVRLAVGATLMYNGPTQQYPEGPKLSMEDTQTQIALNQIVVKANREQADHFEVTSEDIAYLRKFARPPFLHGITYGYLEEALKTAETMTPATTEGIPMT